MGNDIRVGLQSLFSPRPKKELTQVGKLINRLNVSVARLDGIGDAQKNLTNYLGKLDFSKLSDPAAAMMFQNIRSKLNEITDDGLKQEAEKTLTDQYTRQLNKPEI